VFSGTAVAVRPPVLPQGGPCPNAQPSSRPAAGVSVTSQKASGAMEAGGPDPWRHQPQQQQRQGSWVGEEEASDAQDAMLSR